MNRSGDAEDKIARNMYDRWRVKVDLRSLLGREDRAVCSSPSLSFSLCCVSYFVNLVFRVP